MKTVRDWISEIKNEEIRTKALNNMQKQHCQGRHIVHDLGDALLGAFVFRNSDEGLEYWWKLYLKCSTGKPL